MALVKEVTDGVEAIAQAIESVRTIARAVREGKDYLAATHPEAQTDLKLMLAELRKTMNLVAEASAVLTQFRFAVSADARSGELARFNDYFIHHKGQADHLERHVDDLRGHCGKIREHASKIAGSATVEGFAKLFAWLGLRSTERELDLARKLDQFAYEDFQMANSARSMLALLKRGLDDVQDALGERGRMHAENVPAAASALADYGEAFRHLEGRARDAAEDLYQAVAASG